MDNSDEILVDFSEKEFDWEYEKFPCDKCEKTFDTKRSLTMHKLKMHKESHIETVNLTENENHYCKKCTEMFTERDHLEIHIKNHHRTVHNREVKRLKVRFQEVMDERKKNEEWVKLKSQDQTEAVNYAKIKVTAENATQVKEAKEEENKF